ncbi:MAG: sterol desaturase family protein [Elainellaceae cyanobacterium]
MNLETLGFYWIAFFWIILGRYFLIAGGIHWLIYSALRHHVIRRRLRLKPPTRKSIQNDIELSISSTVLFAICSAVVMLAYHHGSTRLYTDIHTYGLRYVGISFVAVLFLQDTYFYFIHRALHHPMVFKWLHQGHHHSGVPTPWTSFAFDPVEALIQGLFFVGLVVIVPLHFITLIAVLMTMTLWAVITHLGIRLFPALPLCRWCGWWLIGSHHHLIHHRKHTRHYGLYFTFWDRALGTHDPSYDCERQVDSFLGTKIKQG